MKKLLVLVWLFAFTVAAADHWIRAADQDQAKGKKVEFTVHDGYFQSNKAGLKGPASYLAFTEQAAFDKIFGKAVVMGKKWNFLPQGAFASKVAVPVIKRGNAIWTYKVDQVTADKDTLYVQYEAKSRDGGGASFASPLIISVDKGKYATVVFIENGKKVGTATIGK
jgi:hypothetical protein